MTATARAIPRSILYTPALSLDRVLKARSYDADIHLIDLEASVPRPAKADARAICRLALDRSPDLTRTAVRVNELGTIEAVHDITMLAAGPAVPGLVLMTLVRFPAEVILLRETLASAGWRPEIYVTVETVEAVTGIDGIAAVSDGLVLGSADLAATLGIEISWEGLLSARQAMALACARHGIACIDTCNFLLADPATLAEEIERARALGFHGKVTVHPRELDAINLAFRPAEAELRAARQVADAVRAAAGGVTVLDDHMVGPPFARRAHATLALSQAWTARFGRAADANTDGKAPAHELD